MFTAVPAAIWAFLFVAILLLALIVIRASNSEKSNIKFTWNRSTGILESSDPEVSVRVFGSAYGEPRSEYVLKIGDRRIGFATITPTQKTSDGRRIWVVDALCIEVRRGRNPSTTFAFRTLFIDRAEQTRAIYLIKSALKNFDGENQGERKVNSVVEFSDRVKQQLSSGELIQQ